MPSIRAEQVQDLTLKDLQIANNAAIEQHKIKHWDTTVAAAQADPNNTDPNTDAMDWISQGIIKAVTTAELPVWDGSQAGQFYYDVNTNEIFIGISTAPYYALIAGDGGSSTGDTVLKDRIIVVKNSTEAENWTGADEFDVSGTAGVFSLDTYKVSSDGSNLLLYLNGVLQERGSGNDYTLYSEMEGLVDPDGNPQATDKIQFTYNLEGPEQKISAIISVDEYLVNYATKAYVDSILMDESAHDHNGSGTPQLDFNEAITTVSLSNITRDIIPAEGSSLDLGSPTRKFANIYASEGHFDASTIYLGGVALSGFGNTLNVSKDGGTTYVEVPVSNSTTEPATLTSGAGQEVILESDTAIITRGDLTAEGDILPDMTGATGDVSVYNVGSPTQRFNSVYADEVFVGASSLYVNGKKVIADNSDEMTFSTDTDQAMKLQTSASTPGSGNANITIQSGNEFNVIASGGMEWTVGSGVATKHMNFSNSSVGGNLTFTTDGTSSQIQMNAAEEIDLTAPTIDMHGNLVLTGDLTVTGTTITVNTETLSTSDNIMVLNNDVTGAPTQNAGIEIERGTENNYQIIFDESNDVFKIGEEASLQSVATRQDAPTSNGIAYYNSTADRFDTSAGFTMEDVTNIPTDLIGTLTSGEQLTVDVLHTNGKGIGNLYIAGAAIDSNTTIRIGGGYAAGMATVGTAFGGTASAPLFSGPLTGNVTGNVTGTVSGNAGSATKLATARTIDITGDITATAVSFDGTSNIAISAAVNNDSHTHSNATLPDVAAGSSTVGFVAYNGTTNAGGKFYGGTVDPANTNRLNYDGYLYATRVYNAVYNDIAEFMPAVDKGEAGMVMVQTADGLKPCDTRGTGAVVGVYSDTYGYALGADDEENKTPVGISGRVWVWVEETCAIGDLLITSEKKGFGTVKRAGEDGLGKVFGKVMEEKTDSTPQRVEVLIMMA